MKKQDRSQNNKAETPPFIGRVLSFLSGFYIIAALIPCGVFFWSGDLFFALTAGVLFSSIFSMIFYKTDKNLAEHQYFRIPEWNLHCWDLFWGWPGGFLAQQFFRHKTKKVSFQIFFWLTLLVNIALTVYVFNNRNALYDLKDSCSKYFKSAITDTEEIL